MKWVLLSILVCSAFSVDARLPKQPFTASTTTIASLDDESASGEKDTGFDFGTSSSSGERSVDSDEQNTSRIQDPFRLLSRLLQVHLRNFDRVSNDDRTGMPQSPPSFMYPEPTFIRRTSIMNRIPFQIMPSEPNPFEMVPRFPNFPRMPDISSMFHHHTSMFDMDDDEKVPEGYVKVNETLQGPEGHKMIHTVYERNQTEGPNQFYGVIHKMRPYNPNKDSAITPSKPTKASDAENPKKDDDRRIAAGEQPNAEREVEESVVNPASKPLNPKEAEQPKTDDEQPSSSSPSSSNTPSSSTEKAAADTDSAEPIKNEKSPAENEIPKSDSEEGPTITVKDNKSQP